MDILGRGGHFLSVLLAGDTLSSVGLRARGDFRFQAEDHLGSMLGFDSSAAFRSDRLDLSKLGDLNYVL